MYSGTIGDMPPSLSAMDASLSKMESSSTPTEAALLAARPVDLEKGEIEEPKIGTAQSMSLAVYLSSSPSLPEDSLGKLEERHGTDSPNELSTLHDELELARYEYSALEVRHCKLWGQHQELRKLASTYDDAIRGFSVHEDQTASTEQLLAEAGREGLRAKALEADVLRPIIREAGGLQALVSQTQSVRWLIDQAGGLQELEELVSDAYEFRSKAEEVGGLQVLGLLISEVNLMRSRQQDHAKPICTMDALKELRTKAAKYERLEQTFLESRHVPTDAANGRSLLQTSSAPMQAPGIVMAVKASTQLDLIHSRRDTSFDARDTMNAARASRMSATPVETDPDRGSYEATFPVMVGPSHVPTGSDKRHAWETLKRKENDELSANAWKRPRGNVELASPLVQATLASKSAKPSSYDLTQIDWRGARIADRGRIGDSGHLESQFENRPVTPAPPSNAVAATSPFESQPKNETRASACLRATSMTNAIHPSRLPMIKRENTEDDRVLQYPMAYSNTDINFRQNAYDQLVHYAAAVWTGPTKPGVHFTPGELKYTYAIPPDLTHFLTSELTKYIRGENIAKWNSMPATGDMCILRYLIDGHSPSAQSQKRRACKNCQGIFTKHHRPCALFQDVDGVRTIVFLPLPEYYRQGINWTDTKFWVLAE